MHSSYIILFFQMLPNGELFVDHQGKINRDGNSDSNSNGYQTKNGIWNEVTLCFLI